MCGLQKEDWSKAKMKQLVAWVCGKNVSFWIFEEEYVWQNDMN